MMIAASQAEGLAYRAKDEKSNGITFQLMP